MKGCFICPIYDKNKDFQYGYALTESARKCGVIKDLYFIFSSDEQKDKFMIHCKRHIGECPSALVYAKDMSDCKNPVSIKKYYGLWKLKDKYDYLAAIDCECIFVKELNAGELMREIWDKQSHLSCNLAGRAAEDVRICANALGLEDSEILKKETDNFSCTWWFNEIPVYKSDTLDVFFDWLDKDNGTRYRSVYYNWHCFDYLVYVIWLLLFENAHLRIYQWKAANGVIESLHIPKMRNKTKIEIELGTHWTSRKYLLFQNENIYMQFHLDRQKHRIYKYTKRKVKKLLKSMLRMLGLG